MGDDETEMSARDRRREAAKARSGGTAGRTFKKYRVHVAILLIFGVIVAVMAVDAGKGTACPGHWHSSQDVFVHGERIGFNHPKFKLEGGQGMPVSSHMHQDSDAQWHWEPTTANTCIPYGDALRFVDMDLEPGRLVLDGAHADLGQAGTYRDGENGTLVAEHKVGDGDWEEISISRLVDRQMQPDERVLIRFDNGTTDVAAMRQQAESHQIQGSSGGTGGTNYVPVFGVGLIGLVVLGAWHMLSRKA